MTKQKKKQGMQFKDWKSLKIVKSSSDRYAHRKTLQASRTYTVDSSGNREFSADMYMY